VRAQLVVDRIGRDSGIEVTNEDLTRQVTEEAARLDMPARELAQFMSEPERLGVLFTDAFRRKTIDHILERIEIVDAPPPELDDELDAEEPAVDDAGPEEATAENTATGDAADTTDDESAEVAAE
jgi:FKBP-type peptidyl-prolyl cis-trans isomerase (trigger factor)